MDGIIKYLTLDDDFMVQGKMCTIELNNKAANLALVLFVKEAKLQLKIKGFN